MSDFIHQQRQLKQQMEALDQLESEFLKSLWNTAPKSDTDLRTRNKHLMALLERTGDLPPALVLRLFYSLEHRAQQEITKPTLLAQTSDPDSLAGALPSLLIANTHTAHEEAFKVRQSAQCTQASKHKRPKGRHEQRAIVETILQGWLDKGRFSAARRGDRAAFIHHILNKHSSLGIQRSQTLNKWINEYLLEKKLVHLTPPAG